MGYLMLNLLWIREGSVKCYSFPSKIHILSKNLLKVDWNALTLGDGRSSRNQNMLIFNLQEKLLELTIFFCEF